MIKTFDKFVLESFIRETMKAYTYKWIDDNTLEFYKKDKVVGKYKLDNTRIEAKGKVIEKFLKNLIKQKEEADKNKLTKQKAAKSVFKTIYNDLNSYNGLADNYIMFDLMNKQFKKIGVEEVIIRKTINSNNLAPKKITLNMDGNPQERISVYNDEGYYTRLRDFLFAEYEHDVKEKSSFYVSNKPKWLFQAENEKIKDIKLRNMLVGRYYLERNFIHLYFNPFLVKKILPLGSVMPKIFIELFKELQKLNIKVRDTSSFSKKMFVATFLEGSRKRLKRLIQDKKDNINRISDRETQIRLALERLAEIEEETAFIEKNIRMKGKGMLKELDTVRKLKFIKDLKMGTDYIELKYVPTTLTFSDFKRSDRGKGYGKRTIYLGEITARITPGSFTIKNSINIDRGGHAHSHADGNPGSPCFGSGGGRNKIYELLSQNKFTELAKILWFWIKTHRNEGAYVKMWTIYDYMLSNGYPVWDEKGNRIKINDAKRLKSKEQRKLDKSSKYATNIKKFADFKLV